MGIFNFSNNIDKKIGQYIFLHEDSSEGCLIFSLHSAAHLDELSAKKESAYLVLKGKENIKSEHLLESVSGILKFVDVTDCSAVQSRLKNISNEVEIIYFPGLQLKNKELKQTYLIHKNNLSIRHSYLYDKLASISLEFFLDESFKNLVTDNLNALSHRIERLDYLSVDYKKDFITISKQLSDIKRYIVLKESHNKGMASRHLKKDKNTLNNKLQGLYKKLSFVSGVSENVDKCDLVACSIEKLNNLAKQIEGLSYQLPHYETDLIRITNELANIDEDIYNYCREKVISALEKVQDHINKLSVRSNTKHGFSKETLAQEVSAAKFPSVIRLR